AITAEARVLPIAARYSGLDTNVNCPAAACSIPPTPWISMAAFPSSWHPRRSAIAPSFITRSLGRGELRSRPINLHSTLVGTVQQQSRGLFGKQAGLNGGGGGGLAPGHANHPEHGHFGEGGARNENAHGG